MVNNPRFGLYFYSWYSKKKWDEHPVLHTPQIGWYRSSDMAAIDWQIKKIASLNIDYVIFEFVDENDWCFEETILTIKQFIPALRNAGVGYTFLLDVWVDHKNSQSTSFNLMLAQLERNDLLNDIEKGVDGRPLVYVFNSDCDQAEMILKNHSSIDIRIAAWIPTWKSFDAVQKSLTKRNDPGHLDKFFGRHWNSASTASETLERLQYCQFWQTSDETLSMNGIASVIPGYDDLLMRRDPQMAEVVPRNEGHTLVDQFKRAVETGADNILIYGWNEYFEATTIEPTLEYDDFYVKLTRRLIEQAKRGEVIHFPDDMGKPERADPIYLSPELERAAQRHHDKVARWDQDDYVVVIDVPLPAVIEHGHAVFRNVRVINAGLKPWRLSECEPIRLGVRLLDSSGTVVREGRGDLGVRDIDVGECVQVDLKIEVEGLSVEEKYRADIDLVWEEKFWFDCALVNQISIM